MCSGYQNAHGNFRVFGCNPKPRSVIAQISELTPVLELPVWCGCLYEFTNRTWPFNHVAESGFLCLLEGA